MDGNPSGDPKLAPRRGLFGRGGTRAPKPPREPKRRRSGRFGLSQLSALLSFALVGILIGVGGFVGLLVAERKAGPLTQDKTVVLTREDDDGPIGDQLEKAGVIDNGTLFSVMTLVDGQRSSLKRGEYEFHAGVSMRDVEEMLARHRVVRHKLTIPEGLTSEQIVDRLRESDLLIGDIRETPREGSLYPDTYVFERGDSRNTLLGHMASEQTKAVAEIWQKRSTDLPVKSPGELVTLASIVEKETGKAEERPRVAGVFVNRLQKHMKLQSDPTIVYGLVFGRGTLGHSITRAELQDATPYNTYFIDGLPPGPICNPGRAAMEAVANPARSHDLYFVADGSGGHAFAETLDQHQKNVAHWRQIEKDAKDSKDHLSPDVAPPANVRGEGPDLSGSRYANADGQNPAAFGALAMVASTAPAPALNALASRLSKVADSRRRLNALIGAGGSLSAAKLGAGSADSLGAVVMGVNDPPPGSEEGDMIGGEAAPPAASGGYSVASAPLSPAALADLKARSARYGEGMFSGANPSAVAPVAAQAGAQLAVGAPAARPKYRAFDASEGTALDPLRNRSWDLNSAKTVPITMQ